ncbi:MAG: heavy metal translocating P-type ATPase [Lachnospiraceae bacterium]|nr:heavy metal translocating P-type ATPase [Lachnospiraceae bacterium]
MKFIIKHDIRGRLRIHMVQPHMSCEEADTLLYYLSSLPVVSEAKVYERTADAVILYSDGRETLLAALRSFRYESTNVPQEVLDHSGRSLNRCYQEKLVQKVALRCVGRVFVPFSVRAAYTALKSLRYLWAGLRSLAKGRLDVSVLDAAAIGVSVLRADYSTAGSVMFLLGIGDILEEWTHKKSVGDLARSMSLNVSRVWLKRDGQEILVPAQQICPGDLVVIRTGNVIPFDGLVSEGEAEVNQSSLTGEAVSVHKALGGYVYAGTVVEDGELCIEVKAASDSTRYAKIVSMIEDSERLKSSTESQAESLADRLVPYTLAGTGLVYLLTRNTTRALSVLMVDFSCALKLAMPISVLSAIREAHSHSITVKGGKFLEAVAAADTIVFDKTGTLTKAQPTVKDIVVMGKHTKEDALRVAACLEEHFPHSMAKAVVQAAKERGLDHEEMHSKVNYIVAHGISSYIDGHKVVIGSHHFVFEDEACVVPSEYMERYLAIPEEYSHLYMAVDSLLAAVICIEDPLREEAPDAIRALRNAGIQKVILMTGDSERHAAAVARHIGTDEYFSEVLPEDKARYIEEQKALGRTVIMVGDGINDSPALSASDAGIAISDGAEIVREIADITVAADDLYALVTLKNMSTQLMKRIRQNYRIIVGFNTGLIALGVAGILQPTVSALLHNTSTLAISLRNMKNLLPEEEPRTGR